MGERPEVLGQLELTFGKTVASLAQETAAAIRSQLKGALDANRFNSELSRLIRSDLNEPPHR